MGVDGFMKYKSPNIKKWFGWDPEDLIGTDGWLTVYPDDVERLQAAFMALLQTDHASATVEYRYLCKDGSYKPIELTATNCVADPLIGGVLLNYHDISERRQLERLGKELRSIIDVIGSVTEMRDPYTAGHQRRVSELATAMAIDLGMSEAEVADVRVAGLMHDVGKMSVPAELLSRPCRLSPLEFDVVRAHAEAGYEIISSAKMPDPIAELVRQHHERCDGSGYPRGLHEDELLAGSKVLMVADIAEAMMSHRLYCPALGVEAALGEIERGSGSLYDPAVSRSCVRVFREEGFVFSE
jgi:PAS domain S-box-containing protein/putative nucleotidyltransferase with HDIG domain